MGEVNDFIVVIGRISHVGSFIGGRVCWRCFICGSLVKSAIWVVCLQGADIIVRFRLGGASYGSGLLGAFAGLFLAQVAVMNSGAKAFHGRSYCKGFCMGTLLGALHFRQLSCSRNLCGFSPFPPLRVGSDSLGFRRHRALSR